MSLRGSSDNPYENEAEGRVYGWDGMDGMDGLDGWGIKSVLQFSSYFVGIYIRYIPTYTYNKKLPPTFLWVLKFDFKLGVGEHHFQNYTMYVSF